MLVLDRKTEGDSGHDGGRGEISCVYRKLDGKEVELKRLEIDITPITVEGKSGKKRN